jgi:NAD(P)-dependent dehydrogenase (short-subunit alcohol dehydrogenase family)
MPKTFDLADGASTDPTAAPVQKYASYLSLVDRTVFITGGADGIGSAAVEHFVRQGSQVAFADINEAKALETIERCGGEARHVPVFHHVDLVDIEALQSAVATAQEDFGSLQVLVNNAANDDRHSWDEMTPEYWDDRINVNLRHYFFAIQAVAPAMLDARHGSIVNIGSSSYMRKEDFFLGMPSLSRGSRGSPAHWQKRSGPRVCG